MSQQPLNCIACVMGVSGCGKSTVAELLATHFDVPFCEADALHPEANIRKMAAGIPLDDNDRKPWLIAVRDEIKNLAQRGDSGANKGCVVACSALKEHYRQILKTAHQQVIFIHLAGSFEQIHNRMAARGGHFMPASLLRSQFEALQIPEPGPSVLEFAIDRPAASIATEAAQQLAARVLQEKT